MVRCRACNQHWLVAPKDPAGRTTGWPASVAADLTLPTPASCAWLLRHSSSGNASEGSTTSF
eukprot:scaffold6285_cov121-Isochrysis_galbana.AAC.6